MDTDEPRVVPIGVMARLAHVTPKWLRGEVEAGRIPALMAGDRFVFRPDVVMKIIAERADVSPAQLVSAIVLGRMLHVDPDWLDAEARAGRLPHINAGGRILFNSRAVGDTLLRHAACEGATETDRVSGHESPNWLDSPAIFLNLTPRERHCLDAVGITTIRDLLQRKPKEIESIKGLGESSMRDITLLVNKYLSGTGKRMEWPNSDAE